MRRATVLVPAFPEQNSTYSTRAAGILPAPLRGTRRGRPAILVGHDRCPSRAYSLVHDPSCRWDSHAAAGEPAPRSPWLVLPSVVLVSFRPADRTRPAAARLPPPSFIEHRDRKSTRLNSSH